MTDCICMVQEGQISAEQQTALRAATSEFAKANFGSPADFNWIEVGKGNGFTAAKPSTSVIVSMKADRALAPSERVPLLHQLESIWREHSGRGPDEVVSVITDPAQ